MTILNRLRVLWTLGPLAMASASPPGGGWGNSGSDGGWGNPPPPPGGAGPQPGGQQYQGQGYQGQGYPPAGPAGTESLAIAAVVCAIAGFFFFPLAIVALFLAPAARKKIAVSGGALEGESLCRIAVIISWVVIALAVIVLIVFISLAVFTKDSADSIDKTPAGMILGLR